MRKIEDVVDDQVHAREQAEREAEAARPTATDINRAQQEARARNLPFMLELEQNIIQMLLDDIKESGYVNGQVSDTFMVYKKGFIFWGWHRDEERYAYWTLFHEGESINRWARRDHIVLRRDGILFVEKQYGKFWPYRTTRVDFHDELHSMYENAAHRVHTLFDYVQKAKKHGLLRASFDYRAFKKLFKVLDDHAHFDVGATSLLPKGKRGYPA